MPTGLLERVEAPAEATTYDPDDVDHFVCHCDLSKAWCGVPIIVDPLSDQDLTGDDCPSCQALLLEHQTRCPRGCDCKASERLLFCGVDDMDESENE